MLPHFIIIGAMKSGTTSLYHYLATHPDVAPSSIKEPAFFIRSKNYSRGLSWYESLFDEDASYGIEASTSYTKRHIFPGVPARMHSVLPNAKLIYLLRDPIERVVSHYVHTYAYGREDRPFSQAIRENEHYVNTSRYYYQLQPYLSFYSREQLLLAKSEELGEATAETVCEVFRFLGLSLDYDPAVLKNQYHKSESKKRNSPIERRLYQGSIRNPCLRFAVNCIFRLFREPIERPSVKPVDKEFLIASLAPDVRRLRGFSELSFSDWSL